jgi:hypothetical protein
MGFLSEDIGEYKKVPVTVTFINPDGSTHLEFKEFNLEYSGYLFDTLLNAFDLDYHKFNKKLER